MMRTFVYVVNVLLNVRLMCQKFCISNCSGIPINFNKNLYFYFIFDLRRS